MVTVVILVCSLLYIDHYPGPSDAGRETVVGYNWDHWGVFLRRTSGVIKFEGLWGLWVHMWIALPSPLCLEFCYGLGNCSLAFLYSQRVSSKVGWLTHPSALSYK